MLTLTVQSYSFDFGKVINTFKVLVEDMESAHYLLTTWNRTQTTGGMFPPKDTGRRYREASLVDSTQRELKELQFYTPFSTFCKREWQITCIERSLN